MYRCACRYAMGAAFCAKALPDSRGNVTESNKSLLQTPWVRSFRAADMTLSSPCLGTAARRYIRDFAAALQGLTLLRDSAGPSAKLSASLPRAFEP